MIVECFIVEGRAESNTLDALERSADYISLYNQVSRPPEHSDSGPPQRGNHPPWNPLESLGACFGPSENGAPKFDEKLGSLGAIQVASAGFSLQREHRFHFLLDVTLCSILGSLFDPLWAPKSP